MLKKIAAAFHTQKQQTGVRAFLIRLWILAVVGIGLISAWQHLALGMNNDHQALMQMAKKFLSGKKLYVDYIDLTPPLIYLMYTLPLSFSTLTGLPVYLALNIFTLILILASLGLSVRIMCDSGASSEKIWLGLGTLTFALLGASFMMQIYADREHLILVFAAPFLLLYSPFIRREAVARKWRIAAAVMAAIGFAIKPYYYVFYAAALLFDLWQQRDWKAVARAIEHRIIVGVAIVYALFVCLFFTEYVRVIVPVAWATYGTLGRSLESKLDFITDVLLRIYALPGLLGMGLLWSIAPARIDRGLAYCSLLLLAAVFSYGLNAGWGYTQYPFIALALVFYIVLAVYAVKCCDMIAPPVWRDIGRMLVATCGATLAIVVFAFPAYERAVYDLRQQHNFGRPLEVQSVAEPTLGRLEKHLAVRPRYLLLSTDLWSFYLQKEGTPREAVGRFIYLWALPDLVKRDMTGDRSPLYGTLVDYVAGSLASDIISGTPDLAIVDISPVKRALPVNYPILGFLLRHVRFAEAWQHYELAERFSDCKDRLQTLCAFEVYYRKPD